MRSATLLVGWAVTPQVMFFKRYERSHLILDSVFENTLSATGRNSSQLEADHSKLDKVNRGQEAEKRSVKHGQDRFAT